MNINPRIGPYDQAMKKKVSNQYCSFVKNKVFEVISNSLSRDDRQEEGVRKKKKEVSTYCDHKIELIKNSTASMVKRQSPMFLLLHKLIHVSHTSKLSFSRNKSGVAPSSRP